MGSRPALQPVGPAISAPVVRSQPPEIALPPGGPAGASPAPATNVNNAPLATAATPGELPQPLCELGLDLLPGAGEFPRDRSAPAFEHQPLLAFAAAEQRGWPISGVYWQATALCTGPLYFEEPNVERLGYAAGPLQPAISAAHFFATVPALPYLMTADPPGECIYTLGHYRPGSPAPLRLQYPPLSADGAVVEGGVITGLIFLIP